MYKLSKNKPITMKKQILPIAFLAVTLTSCDDKAITVTELPQSAQAFAKQYYNNATAVSATSEGMFFKEYELQLDNGTKIEFDSDGEWTKIDCHRAAVPTALVPNNVAQDVENRYPNALISEIDKSDSKIKIEVILEQGADLDLEYTESGEFLRIDD